MDNLKFNYKEYKKIFNGLNNIIIINKNNKNITNKIVEKLYQLRIEKLNNIVIKNSINNIKIKSINIKTNTLANINRTYFYNTYNNFFYTLYKIILENIICKDKKWVVCLNECYNLSQTFLHEEINSTIYYLILFGNSYISLDNEKSVITFKFIGDLKNLNGIWEHDMNYFKLKSFNNTNNGRLIMGFGPSAAGKTYWTKNVIKIIKITDNQFPTRFITIDGGIQREVSIAYQIIKNIIKHKCNTGFNNLMSASFLNKKISIFSSSKIKKNIIKFLQIEGQGIPNLYIPETLGGCISKINCENVYKKYIKITNDKNWIGLLIWQHLTTKKCDKEIGFKCTGTETSGLLREIDEGKKYSSLAYDTSMKYGLKELNNSPNIKINIHNSGGKKTNGKFNKSIIKSNLKLNNTQKNSIEKTYNCVWEYVEKF